MYFTGQQQAQPAPFGAATGGAFGAAAQPAAQSAFGFNNPTPFGAATTSMSVKIGANVINAHTLHTHDHVLVQSSGLDNQPSSQHLHLVQPLQLALEVPLEDLGEAP